MCVCGGGGGIVGGASAGDCIVGGASAGDCIVGGRGRDDDIGGGIGWAGGGIGGGSNVGAGGGAGRGGSRARVVSALTCTSKVCSSTHIQHTIPDVVVGNAFKKKLKIPQVWA